MDSPEIHNFASNTDVLYCRCFTVKFCWRYLWQGDCFDCRHVQRLSPYLSIALHLVDFVYGFIVAISLICEVVKDGRDLLLRSICYYRILKIYVAAKHHLPVVLGGILVRHNHSEVEMHLFLVAYMY